MVGADARHPDTFLKHVALVFNALGHGIWRALTIAGIGLVLLIARRWVALIAFALTEALTPLLVQPDQAARRPGAPPGSDARSARLVLPLGPRRLRGRDRGRARPPLQHTRSGAPPGRRRAVATAGMAWSRTYLQVHWLSDALAGATLGVGSRSSVSVSSRPSWAGHRPLDDSLTIRESGPRRDRLPRGEPPSPSE